jgi:tRNA (cytidine56-2'-O)-methyltransferase
MVTVLRLGHRKKRDARLSTHCGLAARALGADSIIYSGEKDCQLLESIKKVSKQWGGRFSVSYEANWRKVIRNFHGTKVHLTMYGLPLQTKIREIRKRKRILVIIGGEKVPGEVYRAVDYNIAVTNQPHSEVAALAVFLHEYHSGRELDRKFNGKLKIVPQEFGKRIINK